MELPSFLQGDSLKRLLQGAAVGALATMIVGFKWGGWTLESTVDKVSKDRAETEVVAVLTPICVDQFRKAVNAPENLIELSKISYSWDRGKFIEKGGWAVMPGSDKSNSAVVSACAELLGKPQAADLR